jgi:hypothetical protein
LTLTPERYRELFQAALPSVVDADSLEPDQQTLYTPALHRRALDPQFALVKGGRGVGKTVWFVSLQDDDLRSLAADSYQLPRLTTTRPLPGYGSALRPASYPGPAEMKQLMSANTEPDLLWGAVLLTALGVAGLRNVDSWTDRIRWVEQHPEAYDRELAEADRKGTERDELSLILFDALDRMHRDRQVTDRLISGILRLALELRTRTRMLRAKVFVRPDMLREEVLQFPDSSKLTANAASLEWDGTSLYGLLFHHLGNSGNPHGKAFRRATPKWRRTGDRYEPPRELTGDELRQQELFTAVAGPYMGANHRRGGTYSWLPNHLMDGAGQVSPRSFLKALVKATEVTSTRYAGHSYALHWEGIKQGVQEASTVRVREITEDLPWVSTAVKQLAGMQVPAEEGEVTDRWAHGDLAGVLVREQAGDSSSEVTTGPQHVRDYPGLIQELIDIGVMTRRADGRLDLPDVYRIAFGLGRRGGVPRVRR